MKIDNIINRSGRRERKKVLNDREITQLGRDQARKDMEEIREKN